MARIVPRSAALLLVLLLAGCASSLSTPRGPDPFGGGATAGHFFLEVQNTLEEDVTVRLRAGRYSRDLGPVSARSNVRLTIPWDDHGRVSVQIEPDTAGRYTFPPREVGLGEALELVILNPLARSRLGR